MIVSRPTGFKGKEMVNAPKKHDPGYAIRVAAADFTAPYAWSGILYIVPTTNITVTLEKPVIGQQLTLVHAGAASTISLDDDLGNALEPLAAGQYTDLLVAMDGSTGPAVPEWPTSNVVIDKAAGLVVDLSSVGITGPLAVADGGTGASTEDGARSSLAVTGGTYTPTRSAEVNMDVNVTLTDGKYQRNGTVVTVSGRFTANPTLAATVTSFEMSLPVASAIAAVDEISGVAFSGTIAGMGAEITGSIANNTAVFSWVSSDVTSQTWSYMFQYEVL